MHRTISRSAPALSLLLALFCPVAPAIPAELALSTFLGGSLDDEALAITTDPAGNIYITGTTWSTDFPLVDPIRSVGPLGDWDLFLVKLDPTGERVLFSSYVGGSLAEQPWRIKADAAGNAYIVGLTGSPTSLATAGAAQTSYGGKGDGFLLKVDTIARRIVYGTYLGGAGEDTALDVALAPDGGVYVVGWSESADFPITPGALDARPPARRRAFLARLVADGSRIEFATFLGNIQDSGALAVGLDAAENIYVAGYTGPGLDVVRAFQPVFGGGHRDAFAMKLDVTASRIEYSTYLGGSANDSAHVGLVVPLDGSLWVHGATWSADFPIARPIQPVHGGGGLDAFVTRLGPRGDRLDFSTFLGGSGGEQASAIALDPDGWIALAGPTGSSDFPAVAALQPFAGGRSDIFLARIDPFTPALAFSTCLGSSELDGIIGMALDPRGNLLPTGVTDGADFPVVRAFQPSFQPPRDSFVARVCPRQLELTAPVAVPAVLWPPNHRMVEVRVDYRALDPCREDISTACTLSVTSDEASDELGDGRTSADWRVLDHRRVLLRAERSGRGPGREYRIEVECRGAAGPPAKAAASVVVPHSHRQ